MTVIENKVSVIENEIKVIIRENEDTIIKNEINKAVSLNVIENKTDEVSSLKLIKTRYTMRMMSTQKTLQ